CFTVRYQVYTRNHAESVRIPDTVCVPGVIHHSGVTDLTCTHHTTSHQPTFPHTCWNTHTVRHRLRRCILRSHSGPVRSCRIR
ncbi:unnamed protein product, partial [Candidula unifasciata]